ncbi:DUF1641 domain-containing protein [Priestia megaterium]|uniref:DUF1641 domain-containing protein n=1 Tax=Priestia megaterium TaxID=1404 RepID=UPI003879D656
MSQSVTGEGSKQENSLNQSISGTTEEQMNVLNQLLQPEMQQSLNVLIDNLPKLSKMVTVLVKAYETGHSLLTDNVLKSDTVEATKQFIEPIEEMVKGIAANAIEAKDRAEANPSTSIGVFGLLRILKEPQVQKVLRFVQAYVDIANKNERQN